MLLPTPARRATARRARLLPLVLTLGGLLATAAPAAPAGAAPLETRVIGTSAQGRPIVAHRVGDPAAPLKVVVLGQTHGNEKPGVTTARHLVDAVPVGRADVWVVPTMNPDGDVADRRANARGVDLNRNFPLPYWAPAGAGTSYWTGPAPASEPETQAVIRFLDEVRPRFLTTIHTPLAAVGRAGKDPDFPARLGAELGLPVGSLTTCTGVPCESDGPPPATLNAWYNASHPGTAVTVEYGPRATVTTAWAQWAAGAIARASYAAPHVPRIAQRYEETGGVPASFLGRPATGELGTPDQVGRFTHYGIGSIYWTPATDARIVVGAIRDRWAGMGWERSLLGYPVTDELPTPDRAGAYNHFQGGSVYWSRRTGAHEVYGDIRTRWASLGWENSRLGFPTRGEHDVPGGRRSTFERGSITWDRATRATTVTYR